LTVLTRGLRTVALGAVVALALVAALATPAVAHAAQGTHNWYWPTGRESFGTMDRWLVARPGAWHLAQDMPGSCGASVYAVADGVVLESKYVDGYGPGGSKGGAVVILHKTAQGKEFWALYGHLKDLRCSKGQKVKAGAVIGRINADSPTHLHFGIHVGRSYPSDKNPFRGHTYVRSNLYGYVNPVSFLRTEWRVIPYLAPTLPLVLRQATDTQTVEVGAADGVAYWLIPAQPGGSEDTSPSVASEDSSRVAEPPAFVWWKRAIPSGVATSLPASSTPPAFDSSRYLVAVNARDSAPGFTVADKRPNVAVTRHAGTPAWRAGAGIAGKVTSRSGGAFQGLRVSLQRWSGSTWSTVASSITLPNGTYSLPWVPTARSTLRVAVKPLSPFVASSSATLTTAPHVALSAPRMTSRTRTRVGVSGTLAPRHSPGTRAVIVRFERYESGRWVRRISSWAAVSDVSEGSAYRRTITLGLRGAWRMRAEHPLDRAHAATATPWVRFAIP
jgi:hypothetical protein